MGWAHVLTNRMSTMVPTVDGKAGTDGTARECLEAVEKEREESPGTGGKEAPARSGETILHRECGCKQKWLYGGNTTSCDHTPDPLCLADVLPDRIQDLEQALVEERPHLHGYDCLT